MRRATPHTEKDRPMNLYNLDSNLNTLENDLVNRVRRCWNKRQHFNTEHERNNLKDAIRELHTYRTNRKRNPELHAKLDAEAVACYRGKHLLLPPTESQWEIFCRNKHLLTRTPLDQPIQESLIEELPVPAEKTKGRVRTRPSEEKITRDYFTQTRTEIEDKGNLTPYLPVRQMCGFITEANEQRAFLNSVRFLAKEREDTPDYSREYKRIHRMATRVLNELDEIQINGIQLDFTGKLILA